MVVDSSGMRLEGSAQNRTLLQICRTGSHVILLIMRSEMSDAALKRESFDRARKALPAQLFDLH